MQCRRQFIAALLAAVASLGAFAQEAEQPAPLPPPVPATTPVILHTNLGDIRVALEAERAPITTKNFLRYVDAKRFDNIVFYRAVQVGEEGKFGLVQAGLRGNRKLVYPPIAHESPASTGLSHLDGAISMARLEPGTAAADFFFIVGDLVSLDGKPDGDPGYAVFGRVTEGMDIVRTIMGLPRSETAQEESMKGQMLAVPIKIFTVRRAE